MQHSMEIRGFILDLNSSEWQKGNQDLTINFIMLRFRKMQTRHQ
jgi:hypothetical protein